MASQRKTRTFDRSILKSFWQRISNGEFCIAGLKGLPLDPVEGSSDPQFYAIADGLITEQPNILGTRLYFLGESIVPIVALVPKERVMRSIGTGYFVSCSGLLITAAHVVTDPIDRRYANAAEIDIESVSSPDIVLGVLVPTNPIFGPAAYMFHRLEWSHILAEHRDSPLLFLSQGVDLKLNSDIAICKVAARGNGEFYQPLTVIQPRLLGTGVAVGSLITAIGYAAMTDHEIQVNGNSITLPPLGGKFKLFASQGTVIERFPQNYTEKNASTPGPCFRFLAKIPGGMSGGPTFDREGIYVHGVVSKGLEGVDGTENDSFGSMLAPSMSIAIGRLSGRSLFQIQVAGAEGMAKFSGPDI